MSSTQNPPGYAYFFGTIGVALATSLCAIGSAYATARGSVGICSIAAMRPELLMKSLLPVIMGSVIGLYGLIISLMILNKLKSNYSVFNGFAHFASGLTVGICGIAAGAAIGILGDSAIRAYAQQPKVYVTMIILLVFAEVLAIYGMIVGIFLAFV